MIINRLSKFFSVFPTLMELIVECTYPVDQATSSALLYFSSSIQAVALMLAETALYRPLSEAEMEIQTCSEKGDTSHEQAKDYSPYVIFITSYVAVFAVVYILFFHPEMKRSNADNVLLRDDKEDRVTMSTLTNESDRLVKTDDNFVGPVETNIPVTSSQPLLSVSNHKANGIDKNVNSTSVER